MRQFRRVATLVLLLAVTSFAQVNSGGKVHTYYVAADEMDWNYTPLGVDQMMGMPFMDYAMLFTERGPSRNGSVVRRN
jgi:hephaestin